MPLANFHRLDESRIFNETCISYNDKVRRGIANLVNKIDIVVISAAWLIYYNGSDLFKEISKQRAIQGLSNISISLNGIEEVPHYKKEEVFGSYFDNILNLLRLKSNNVIILGPIPPALMNFNRKDSLLTPQNLKFQDFAQQSNELRSII